MKNLSGIFRGKARWYVSPQSGMDQTDGRFCFIRFAMRKERKYAFRDTMRIYVAIPFELWAQSRSHTKNTFARAPSLRAGSFQT